MKTNHKNKNRNREFNCPSCGNPLLESYKEAIKCPYCGTIIVPKNSKLHREEHIYEKKADC